MPDPAPVVLKLGQSITTAETQMLVAGYTQPGVYTFQLVVVDAHGIASQPAVLRVQVTKSA